MEGATSMSAVQGFHTFLTAAPTICQQPGSTYAHLLIEAKKMTESQLLLGERIFLFFNKKEAEAYRAEQVFHITGCSADQWWETDRELWNPRLDWRKTDFSFISPYVHLITRLVEAMVTSAFPPRDMQEGHEVLTPSRKSSRVMG